MHIPHTALKPETLRAVIEEFVLREGTDYGGVDLTLDDKVSAVMRQLEEGTAHVAYDAETESCTLLTNDAFRRR